jgi:tetratricopeptide (TPR) repeat protein
VTPRDHHHLRAAQGWLELGNWLEANAELENITPQQRAHPDVLRLRVDIYAAAKKWDYVVEVASALSRMIPDDSFGHIRLAFALHELKRTREAYDVLLPTVDKFPGEWTISYNLACYCAQLGRLEECQQWFKQAMAMDEDTVKRVAIDDPDLKPLWDSLSGIPWKRVE